MLIESSFYILPYFCISLNVPSIFFLDVVTKLNVLLGRCLFSASIEYEIQSTIKNSISLDDAPKDMRIQTPYLFSLEKTLLALSTYSECTDGILYAIPIIVDLEDGSYIYVRYVFLLVFDANELINKVVLFSPCICICVHTFVS